VEELGLDCAVSVLWTGRSGTVVGITWTLILDPGRWMLDFGLYRLDSISAAGDGLVAISLRALDKLFPTRGLQT
jgi:hypothetical protein